MNTVTKEEYWSIILNDPTQIGQIITEDTEFNRRINDVNLVLSNTFINSSDENLISKWETSLYIDGIEGKTITERKADILYTLCEKNYVPVSIIKRFLLNLIGDENKFVVEFIKDENKLVIHTDRADDNQVAAMTSLLDEVMPQNVEVVRYNHNIEISWRDLNKYAECVTVADMVAVNPDYGNDLTTEGEWLYDLSSLKAMSVFANNKEITVFNANLCKSHYSVFSMFSGATKLREVHGDFSGKISADNMCRGCTSLSVFTPTLPDLGTFSAPPTNIFSGCILNKESVLSFLGSLNAGNDKTMTIGIHVDHKNDNEVLEVIANAEAKNWNLTVQWNGAATAQASATYSLRKPPIYARVGEMERPDGTTERILVWGHYVTDPSGYEEFPSLESAYKYFNLEQPTEI